MPGMGSLAGLGGMGASSLAGPLGMALGGITGAVSDNQKKKAKERDESNPNSPNFRPKHRRMTQIQQTLNAFREQKLAGKLTMAQSAFNWADSLRI